MRKLLNRKIVEPGRICAICHFEFTDYNEVVRDHKTPKGIGGTFYDDHPANTSHIGGAIRTKDQRGWTSDGRLASFSPNK